jgi:hypothetical protein
VSLESASVQPISHFGGISYDSLPIVHISTRFPNDLESPISGSEPLTSLRLEGTGTSFDQIYYPESVTRSLFCHDGFKQEVRAKNSSPRSQVQIT